MLPSEERRDKTARRDPIAAFFATPAHWREWLAKHHETERELLVGFYKKGSDRPSITWPESVDAALCFGWIDGIRRSIDAESYSIRFTSRRPRSVWSAVNMKRIVELIELGLVHPAGLKAWEARTAERSGVYSFEQRPTDFEPAQARQFRTNRAAWKYFASQTPSYRRAMIWWVISAKREETKVKRLASLIEYSQQGQTVPQFTPSYLRKKF